MFAALQEREVVIFLIALVISGFLVVQWHTLRRVPHVRILLAAFAFLVFSWFCTNLEEVFEARSGADALLPTILNIAEHSGGAISTILIALWCRRLRGLPEESLRP